MFTCFANIIIHKGTKNVAKSMSKIAVGSQKNAGKTWFPELTYVDRYTIYHAYYL